MYLDLYTDEHNHWIPVLVRREENQQVHIILTDSIGIDQRNIDEIINVYQDLVTHIVQP
jgi:light-regulated signal transduction histidine kinase (bacteriophytochrome)